MNIKDVLKPKTAEEIKDDIQKKLSSLTPKEKFYNCIHNGFTSELREVISKMRPDSLKANINEGFWDSLRIRKSLEITEILIDNGANINFKYHPTDNNKNSDFTLWILIDADYLELLLKKGMKMDEQLSMYVLFNSVSFRDEDADIYLKLLLKYGVAKKFTDKIKKYA